MIAKGFAIWNQLLSGSDDSIEGMTERLRAWARAASLLVRLLRWHAQNGHKRDSMGWRLWRSLG
jgi:hypothetical protein